MKITEPYLADQAASKESAAPVMIAGISAGMMTRRNVCPREAPSVADASSASSA